MYAKLEEEHGLARHAMSIYNRATKKVSKEEMIDVILFWNKFCLLIFFRKSQLLL